MRQLSMGPRSCLFLIFLFINIRVSLLKSVTCSDDELAVCQNELETFQNMPFYHINNTTEMEITCKRKFELLECIQRYVSSCFSATDQQQYKVLTSGSWKFLEQFCSPDSDVRRKYMRHVSCFTKISPKLDECAEKYEESQEQLYEENLISTILLQRTCCIYFEYIRCSSNLTEESCGSEATNLITDLLIQRGGTYLNSKCEKYYKDCSTNGGAEHVKMNNLLNGFGLSNVIFIFLVQCFIVMIMLNTN